MSGLFYPERFHRNLLSLTGLYAWMFYSPSEFMWDVGSPGHVTSYCCAVAGFRISAFSPSAIETSWMMFYIFFLKNRGLFLLFYRPSCIIAPIRNSWRLFLNRGRNISRERQTQWVSIILTALILCSSSCSRLRLYWQTQILQTFNINVTI